MSDHPDRRKRRLLTKSEQMARVRSRDTGPEMVLRRALWHRGLRYRLRLQLPGTPDLAFIGPKVAVFVDGCFWHGCPEHYREPATNTEYWRRKVERNVGRDRLADEALVAQGWAVIRVWEHEVRQNMAGVVDRIARAVHHERGPAND